MSAPDPVLVAQRLSKDYWVDDPERGRVKARVVEDASIALVPGAIHALVGESGSGKSTLARMLGFVVRPSAGRIVLGGAVQRRKTPSRAMLRRVQILFQDPYGSLNPLQRLRYILGRPLRLHGYARTRRDVDAGVNEVLESVSLNPAADFIDRRPAELSGGQRQRVVIARALATRPDVILADEPVSMLDVSIRLEILHLLKRLSADQEVAMLFVTHDIASARYVAQSISVMYAGRIVEAGPIADVIDRPLHPYTRLLVESTPDAPAPGERRAARALLRRVDAGEPPTVTQRPQGCRFQPRCPAATDICAQQQPPTVEIAAQRAECWHPLRPVTQSHPSDTAGSERA